MDSQKLIEKMRRRFGEVPRKFSIFDGFYNRVTPPDWMKRLKDTRLQCIYNDQKYLFREGEVVWGHLVQANSLLFEPGDSDCPASIVYSLEPLFDGHLKKLEALGYGLYEFKGTEVRDNELAYIIEVITDEYKMPFNVRLPNSFTNNREVYFTSVMVCRKHLPNQFLKASWFPVVTAPGKTDATMIVPSRYWDDDLLGSWLATR